MARNINYDRGVMKRTHPGTGVNIYMYLDTPGVFLSAHGTEVSIDLARAAGFDVDDLGKQRQMALRMKEAQDAIRREFAMRDNKVLIVKEKKGFVVQDIGLGRHQVLDPDGNVLTREVLTKELALAVLEQIVPGDPDPVSETEKPAEKEARKPSKQAKS